MIFNGKRIAQLERDIESLRGVVFSLIEQNLVHNVLENSGMAYRAHTTPVKNIVLDLKERVEALEKGKP